MSPITDQFSTIFEILSLFNWSKKEKNDTSKNIKDNNDKEIDNYEMKTLKKSCEENIGSTLPTKTTMNNLVDLIDQTIQDYCIENNSRAFKINYYWISDFSTVLIIPSDVTLKDFKIFATQQFGEKYLVPDDCVVLAHTQNFDLLRDVVRIKGATESRNAIHFVGLVVMNKIKIVSSEIAWKNCLAMNCSVVEVTIFSKEMLTY
ncbi:7848_t:CDS:1 [Dentiscutata erythropus]|uniref:7848_t:CDS:1 n=1 Tax=Dentiscutata erythropus TaxID=1348616 RepID=A0A9N9FNJ5_9GLOM|nr:7848_t:CDS:1 [Dentiscutata erythropus]